MTALEKYEEKKKALNRHFAKQYLKVWILFFIYNAVADLVIYLIRDFITSPIAVVAVLVSTGLSFYISLKSIADLRNIKTAQENKLIQELPISKINI